MLETLPPPPLVDVARDSRGQGPRLRLAATRGAVQAADDRLKERGEPAIAYLRVIHFEGRELLLPHPVKVEVERTEEGSVSVFSPALEAFGLGDSHEQAVADLEDSLERLWIEFRDEPEDALHSSAQSLRRKLARIFER